ncbi:hypothetical protein V8F06_000967 [Rhypophila decipiens]
MSSYDDYDGPTRQRSTKRYYREERREDPRDPYLSVQSRDLVTQHRTDSDLSVEEIRRDFPPPGYSSRDIRRARSAEGGYYNDYDDRPRSSYGREREYDRDYDRDYDRPRSHRKTSMTLYEEEEHKKVRMLSKQEQIIAAITGAALAIGGKEAYDRKEAGGHGGEIQRNLMASAALGAAGALAGYSGTELYNKRKQKEEKKIAHRGYYSDEEDDGKDKKSNKNFLESALAAAGLGGAIKALSGGKEKDDDKSDTRSRRGSPSRSVKSDKGKGDGKSKVQKAAMASLIAGATEAFRVSKEPGGWKGEKAKRILTAAAGAATIDAAQKDEKAGSKMGLAESVIGGLVGNRVINGSKKNIEEDAKTGRSRSRSRAASGAGGSSGLAALATAGLGAFGAKKLYDKHEETKEKERSRSRRPRSRDSNDSRDGSPDKRHRSRSRSVVDGARRGLAKLGIGNAPSDDERDDRDRDRSRNRRDRSRRRDYDDDDYDEPPRNSRRHRDRRDDYSDDDRDYHRDRGTVSKRRDASRGGSESDLGDSDDDEKQTRRMRGKQILTTGLAVVATIHAGNNVYQSMDKRQKRQKAVREGKITVEEAEKLKKKAILQDVASVGIAALGIKGAISEMKEAREKTAEIQEWKEKKEERHRKRMERIRLGELRLLQGGDGDGYGDFGRQRADIWYPAAAPPRSSRRDEGPHYIDGNPYSALPPPSPSEGGRR